MLPIRLGLVIRLEGAFKRHLRKGTYEASSGESHKYVNFEECSLNDCF